MAGRRDGGLDVCGLAFFVLFWFTQTLFSCKSFDPPKAGRRFPTNVNEGPEGYLLLEAMGALRPGLMMKGSWCIWKCNKKTDVVG